MRKRYLFLLSIIMPLVGAVLLRVWNPPTTSVRRDFQMTTWGTAVTWEPLDHATTKAVLVRRRFWSSAGNAVFELLPDTGPKLWYDDRNGTVVRVPPASATGGWFDPRGRVGDCYWLRELGQQQSNGQSNNPPPGLRLVRTTFLGCRFL